MHYFARLSPVTMFLLSLLVFADAYTGITKTYAENLSVANRSTSYWFHTCGSTGRIGPTSDQCKEFYPVHRNPIVNVSIDDIGLPGVQVWRVPKTNQYDISMYGATGGFGIDSTTIPGLIRGTGYINKGVSSLPSWPSRLHIRADLVEGEELYIVVGQAGLMACQQNSYQDCKNENITSKQGGGGGGGGASMVFLKRNETIHLLAIAGGGGGMGRRDMPHKLSGANYLETYLQRECSNPNCSSSAVVRPGFGGSFVVDTNSTRKTTRQDGRSLDWLTSVKFLLGGKGCGKYRTFYETHGGFGGGGGGCTAGGGGGGYWGGNISLIDNGEMPGQQGSSYYNKELTVRVQFDQHDPYTMQHPDGMVEVTEVPPDCRCGDRNCRWQDGTYTSYMCECDDRWVVPHELATCTDGQSSEVTQEEPANHYIVYGILGGVVIVLIAVVVTCCLKWKTVRRKAKFKTPYQVKLDSNPDYGVYDGMPTMLSEDRIKIVRCLGEGTFSKVYQARLALSDTWDSEEISVAVKKPITNTAQTRHEFLQEAKTISAFNHPNIMKILGICELSDGGIGIVMDVLKGGDLKTFLRNNQQAESSSLNLRFGDLLKISAEIASACKYLEEMKFIHRDIAARNVLLTELGEGRVAKISDFGLSRDINYSDYYCHRRPVPIPIPIRWYPPEAVKKNKQTTKSDIWSFGILLWEVFTLGVQPYPNIVSNAEVAECLVAGYTMDPPSTCPMPIAELMRKCWRFNPEDRPSFGFIYLQLSRMMQNTQMTCKLITECNHLRLPSVTSSNSSGFDESLESPSCLSLKPLISESNYPADNVE